MLSWCRFVLLSLEQLFLRDLFVSSSECREVVWCAEFGKKTKEEKLSFLLVLIWNQDHGNLQPFAIRWNCSCGAIQLVCPSGSVHGIRRAYNFLSCQTGDHCKAKSGKHTMKFKFLLRGQEFERSKHGTGTSNPKHNSRQTTHSRSNKVRCGKGGSSSLVQAK